MQVPEARCTFRISLGDILVAARAIRLWAGCISVGGRCVVASLGALVPARLPAVWPPGGGSVWPWLHGGAHPVQAISEFSNEKQMDAFAILSGCEIHIFWIRITFFWIYIFFGVKFYLKKSMRNRFRKHRPRTMVLFVFVVCLFVNGTLFLFCFCVCVVLCCCFLFSCSFFF